MHKRAIAATIAALSALFLVAWPASAESAYVGAEVSIDWRLVVIFVLVGLFVFFAVQQLMNRGR
jgi:hypothetical protein